MNNYSSEFLGSMIQPPLGAGGIQLTNAGKRFNREWIFRKLTYQFHINQSYAITGPNGSGKSTLLQCIAGSTNISEGNIQVDNGQLTIDKGQTANTQQTNFQFSIFNFQLFSIAAPYLELIEEMTAKEFLAFHQAFKPFLPEITIDEILLTVGLTKAAEKQIRYYSSGMKQRLKLAQAFFSNVPVVLLDEPCTNLDAEGYALYHQLIKNYTTNRLVIVCSNEEKEINFCNQRLNILDWK